MKQMKILSNWKLVPSWSLKTKSFSYSECNENDLENGMVGNFVFTHFIPLVSFYTPLKTSENEKTSLTGNGLKVQKW